MFGSMVPAWGLICFFCSSWLPLEFQISTVRGECHSFTVFFSLGSVAVSVRDFRPLRGVRVFPQPEWSTFLVVPPHALYSATAVRVVYP